MYHANAGCWMDMNRNFWVRSMVIGAYVFLNCAMTMGQVMELSHRNIKI